MRRRDVTAPPWWWRPWLTMADPVRGELEERWRRAMARNPWPRILTPLPWRTRLRLAASRAIDTIGCWLCDHKHPELAMWWWRAWRQW